MCAVSPCKNELPRGSQHGRHESKICALAAVIGVVVFGARFFTGAGVAFNGIFFLLFILVKRAREEARQ